MVTTATRPRAISVQPYGARGHTPLAWDSGREWTESVDQFSEIAISPILSLPVYELTKLFHLFRPSLTFFNFIF